MTTRSATARPDLLSVGLYTPVEVSYLLGIPSSTVRNWLEGYSFPLARHFLSRKPPLFLPALPKVKGRLALTFVDLVQLRVVRAFREAGAPLQRIRMAAQFAGEVFGTSHPLAHLRLKTEGRGVWSDSGAGAEREVLDLSAAAQRGFPERVG